MADELTRHDAGPHAATWWTDAVVYQVYLRSFRDGNGDGVGDIAGLRAGLDHLVGLGVDAIWINPWFRSPGLDGGYDVADHRDLDPDFGTLADADALLSEAHERGLRVLLDLVPNHTSSAHPWFQAALAAPADSDDRGRYYFRQGRGHDGDQPPNNWTSAFGGPAWSRVPTADGEPGQWYLHLFSSCQPDLDWTHADVAEDFRETLRFWFDRGVDGFRIDVAHGLHKHGDLPDLPVGHASAAPGHPFWDRDQVHDVYRDWRSLADAYDPPRVFLAEAVADTVERRARYVRDDELHGVFAFDLLEARWTASDLRDAIDRTVAAHGEVTAPPTWVLSNHDVLRHPSRYARDQALVTGHNLVDVVDLQRDDELGDARARAAVLLLLALPGNVVLYQGEELGLHEVEDLPDDLRRDPVWERSDHQDPGRDGCRVPLPWAGDAPPFAFTSDPTVATGQPARWRDHTVAAMDRDPTSTLHLYRSALRIRRAHPALGVGAMSWVPADDGVLALRREPGFACWINLTDHPVRRPAGRVLLRSTAQADNGPDDDVWLRPHEAVWIDDPDVAAPDPLGTNG